MKTATTSSFAADGDDDNNNNNSTTTRRVVINVYVAICAVPLFLCALVVWAVFFVCLLLFVLHESLCASFTTPTVHNRHVKIYYAPLSFLSLFSLHVLFVCWKSFVLLYVGFFSMFVCVFRLWVCREWGQVSRNLHILHHVKTDVEQQQDEERDEISFHPSYTDWQKVFAGMIQRQGWYFAAWGVNSLAWAFVSSPILKYGVMTNPAIGKLGVHVASFSSPSFLGTHASDEELAHHMHTLFGHPAPQNEQENKVMITQSTMSMYAPFGPNLALKGKEKTLFGEWIHGSASSTPRLGFAEFCWVAADTRFDTPPSHKTKRTRFRPTKIVHHIVESTLDNSETDSFSDNEPEEEEKEVVTRRPQTRFEQVFQSLSRFPIGRVRYGWEDGVHVHVGLVNWSVVARCVHVELRVLHVQDSRWSEQLLHEWISAMERFVTEQLPLVLQHVPDSNERDRLLITRELALHAHTTPFGSADASLCRRRRCCCCSSGGDHK